jgi:hypothetical protein
VNEHELRQLVREVLAKHATAGAEDPLPGGTSLPRHHPSHGLFAHLTASDDRCLIEPSVACNHCGYCKSYGH